jgi:hypothetical protein
MTKTITVPNSDFPLLLRGDLNEDYYICSSEDFQEGNDYYRFENSDSELTLDDDGDIIFTCHGTRYKTLWHTDDPTSWYMELIGRFK